MATPETQIETIKEEPVEKTLAGKIFLLTGASRGIGAATAVELAKRGATVIGPHRDPGKEVRAGKVAEEAEKMGGKMIALVADVTKPEDRAKLLHFVKQNFGQVDGIILNHAGGLEKGADENYSLEVNGHSKVALFKEALEGGVLKNQAIVLDVPSLWSKFYFTGAKQMEVYEPVAKGKKLGEKLLREAVRVHNNEDGSDRHIKFGSICGQGIGGTITMRMLEKLYPMEVAEIKQTAEEGKLPEIADMAQAIANMARGDFRDEEVVFVGVPQITEDEMPKALPMYNPETRYVDYLLRFDDIRSFGFYRVKDKDSRAHFSYFESMSLIDVPGIGRGILDVTDQHTEGHFTSEFGLSIFQGHKIVAAAFDIALLELENDSPEFIIPRVSCIKGPVEFKVPVLPGDKLRFLQKGADFSVRIGDIEVASISGVELEPRNLEDPKNITPDRLIEAGAQTLGLGYIRSRNLDEVLPLFGGVKGPVEYRREVFVGELLEMEAVLTGEKGTKQFAGDVIFRVDDEVVAKVLGIDCRLFPREGLARLIRMGRRILV